MGLREKRLAWAMWNSRQRNRARRIASIPPETDFIFTMRTTVVGETVTLPADGVNDFVVDWGDGDTEAITGTYPTHAYANTADHTIKISGTCPSWRFGNSGDKDKLISVSNLGVVGWESLDSAFSGCTNMVEFDFGNTYTSDVTNIGSLFYNCNSLISLDLSGLDTSKVTDMSSSFSDCASLETLNVSGIDVSSVTFMSYLFNSCTTLSSLDVGGWDTGNVTSMSGMFANCTNLAQPEVTGWDISKVTNMSYMFSSFPAMTTTDYDAILSAWSKLTLQPNVKADFGSVKYTDSASRAILTNSPNFWTVNDGGQA